MKKILKISVLAVIFYLCIVPYRYTKAENETEQNTQQEAESNTSAEKTQNENTEKETTETNTSKENQKEEPKQEEPKQDEPKQDEPKQEEPKQEEPKQQEEKQPESPSHTSDSSAQNNQSSSNNQRTRTQQQTREQSSNANLGNLGITPNDFTGFRAATLDYNVTVPNDVEKINVYAKTQDSNAKITSGTGDHNLNVGENAIQVVVTAENGNTQTYTINVKREEKAKEENKVPENVPASDLKKLEVKGYKITPEFSANVYEYKLDVKLDVTELEIITEKQNDKIDIEVVGNKDLKERRKYNHYFSKEWRDQQNFNISNYSK